MRTTRFERKGLHRSHAARRQGEDSSFSGLRNHADDEGEAVFATSLGNTVLDLPGQAGALEKQAESFVEDCDVAAWLCAMAGESPLMRWMMKEAQKGGWRLVLDDLSGDGFDVDAQHLEIVIDHFGFTAKALARSAHFRHIVLLNFVRALRAVQHEARHYRFEQNCNPEAVLMLERAIAADLETMAILAGWELRAGGYSDIWRHILGSDEGDMAMIFTRAIEKDPTGFYDGSVLARTFCQWYGDEIRTSECDAFALERMDEHLDEGGRFGSFALQNRDVERIATLIGGRSYLEGMGANIVTDPYFQTLYDGINQSHLLQVVYDAKVVMVEGVPFRDCALARKIFPETGARRSEARKDAVPE